MKALLKRVLVLTGKPGVGKTTVLSRIVSAVRERGFTVGGMFSREVRDGPSRVGFEVVNVATAQAGWLAHMYQRDGPRVGKYQVNP